MNAIKKFLREEDGVTALEYALLAAVIAGVLALVAGPAIADLFRDVFGNIADKASTVIDTPPTGNTTG